MKLAGKPSDACWVSPDERSMPFKVYCEQELDDGGWAMVMNSVRREDGTTMAFWQFSYDDRLIERGTLSRDQNYYNGALYAIGRQYMDVFTDLNGKTAVAAVMTATGIDQDTMRFTIPAFISGHADVYESQFASGWSASDHDGDPLENSDPALRDNCAAIYGNVAQHYDMCWNYNLGADGDADATLDGGVGPHVNNVILTSLGLSLQRDGGSFSQVKRIARFTRW